MPILRFHETRIADEKNAHRLEDNATGRSTGILPLPLSPEIPRDFEAFLGQSLDEINRQGLLRRLRTLDSPQDVRVVCDGRSLINFSSNDYLGLANHPALKDAAIEAVERAGFGAGASRLVCGTNTAHEELESTLANFKRTPAALSFSSGYAAAMGTIPALCGKDDVIILDKLCHACLVDGARLSGSHLRVFPHNDMGKLDSHLQWAARAHPQAKVMILAESVYSMDGDRALLLEMVALKERFGAWLFLDEAHGVGVFGSGGRGLADELGVAGQIEVQMGTLGKALGAHGAYIAGSRALCDFLINRNRAFIYSTAPPAPVAAAASCAVGIVQSDEGDLLRAMLWQNIRDLEARLGLGKSASAILPLIIGDEQAALKCAAQLLQDGFLVPSIRFPTVARGTARLRITLSAAHRSDDVEALARRCAVLPGLPGRKKTEPPG